MTNELAIKYRPSPTGKKFHADDSFVRGMRGPIGSGKSVMCVMDMFKYAARQLPGRDGIRRSRWAAIRNSYPELKSTTIKTFRDWFPDEICSIKWDSPITATVKVNDIELEVMFLALDKPKDVKKLKSLELTGGWINEASEIPKSIFEMLTGRVGRYPAKKDGGSNWSGVILDTNPPDTDHWWYELAEKTKPRGYRFFHQPPALVRVREGIYVPNPLAENIENHNEGFEYYLRQIAGKTEEWIRVFILGEYGSVMDGKPVYTSYRDDIHCAPERLNVMQGLPLFLGWDYGRTPACAICQFTPRGQLRVLEELLVDPTTDGMGVRAFTREVVRPHLAAHYAGMRIVSRGDPAGEAKDGSDLSCFDIQDEEGVHVVAAPTNDLTPRLDAVAKHMIAMVDGEPGFLLSPNCEWLRRGFLGGYKYERVHVAGDERYKEVPSKNKFSHIQDALQYAALAVDSYEPDVAIARPIVKKPSQGWT